MEAVPVEDLEVEERSDQAEPPPPLGVDAPHLQISAPRSGARLGFLLGVAPSRPASIAAPRSCLPPVGAVAGSGNTRKRGRQPSSDGDAHRQNKGKQKRGKEAAGDAQRHKEKSPCETRTSCSSQALAESVNEISDDEVEEVPAVATRRLTSDVWLEMTKKMLRGKPTAICNYCHKELTAGAKSGTSHLRDHLKICTQRMLKLRSTSGKSLCQSQLRMTAQAEGKVNVESYTFDQETCREELGDMIVLHDYPLSIVDHAGFRRFVHALQPLFKLHTRNTIRKDIIARHDKEKMKAIEYMTMLQSRVVVTTDMWTADNQKKGYMAVTGHFVDESWKLRSILMGFIYVPAPHTRDVIAEELHETLMQWNLDEKLLTVTVDNCTSNDKAVDLMISKIGKSKLLLQAQQKPAAARLQGEIENYLSDDLVPYTEKFNVLDWWKVAGTRYPTLRKVARDIFAIPITSVASESAFSTSGRIVNEHRSRLTSHMLEVLMCYQDWLRNKYKDAHVGEESFWSCLQDTQEEDSDLTFV
ncbi:hypothetical protein ACQ4PT_021666 [Festuca glaucescens]